MYRHLLIDTDVFPESERSLVHGLGLAKLLAAKVTVTEPWIEAGLRYPVDRRPCRQHPKTAPIRPVCRARPVISKTNMRSKESSSTGQRCERGALGRILRGSTSLWVQQTRSPMSSLIGIKVPPPLCATYSSSRDSGAQCRCGGEAI
jgi:hypothetical protein